MTEIYARIFEELDQSKLVEIIRLGKYRIRGFRLDAKRSVAKRQMMLQTLTNAKNIHKVMENYTQKLLQDKKIDNTWTFSSKLEINDVKKRIVDVQLENTILELLSNEKFELINELIPSHDSKTPEDTSTKVIDNKDVMNLRKIINEYEDKNMKHRKTIDDLHLDNNKLKKEIKLLENTILKVKSKENENLKKILNYEGIINEKDNEMIAIQKQVESLNEQNKQSQIKINDLNKVHIIVIGKIFTKDWFNYNNKNNFYEFIFFESDITVEKVMVDEVWVIRNSLSQSEFNKLSKNDYFAKLESIHRVRLFDNFNEIENYMKKMEVIYYEG